MTDARLITGANNGNRHERDFYSTPEDTTEALLDFLEGHSLLNRKETIWECACGLCAMADVMAKRGYRVVVTDIVLGHDFLKDTDEISDWIITNPPFNQAEKFIRHAIELQKPFAFLLKSQYWHAAKRIELFREHPPAFILPLTWRPDFTGQGSSLMDMIWCVWFPNPANKDTVYIPLERRTK